MKADEIIEVEVELRNRYGLHARPAALFVQTCNRFMSDVTVHLDSMSVSGKNILDIMTLGAAPGSIIKLEINGPDAADAAKTLTELVNNNFGEE